MSDSNRRDKPATPRPSQTAHWEPAAPASAASAGEPAAAADAPVDPNIEPGSEADPLLGLVIGNFKIVRLLGRGGMGAVYLGEHVSIGSRVAMKFLHSHLAHERAIVERFYAEARAANLAGHEHIVSVLDLNLLPPDRYYLVMEYLEGQPLSAIVGHGPVAPEIAVPILVQTCEGLQAAHAAGVVHRDLKFENIFLSHRGGRDDFVKILDFGIAKLLDPAVPGLTSAGLLVGTPEYMAPEQWAPGRVDGRADLYTLGIIAYGMLTSRMPFHERDPAGYYTAHREKKPEALRRWVPTIPEALDKAVMRVLAKDPAARFPDARAFGEALQASLGPKPAPRVAPPVPPRPTGAAATRPMAPAATTGQPPRPKPKSSGGSNPPAVIIPAPPPSAAEPAAAPAVPAAAGHLAGAGAGAGAAAGGVVAAKTGAPAAPSAAAPPSTPARGSNGAPAAKRVAAPAAAPGPGGANARMEATLSAPGLPAAMRARVAELTRGGMLLATDDPLPALRTRVNVQIRESATELRCEAEVVRHVTPAQARAWGIAPGFGVQFLALSPEARGAIDVLSGERPSTPRPPEDGGAAPAARNVEVEELLRSWRERAGADPYAILRVDADSDCAWVRFRAHAARAELEAIRPRGLSAEQEREAAQALEWIDAALRLLGAPASRAAHDAEKGNWRGIARCLAAGLTGGEVDALRRSFLAARPEREGKAQQHAASAMRLEASGELTRALGEFREALELDPLSLELHRRYWPLKRRLARLGENHP